MYNQISFKINIFKGSEVDIEKLKLLNVPKDIQEVGCDETTTTFIVIVFEVHAELIEVLLSCVNYLSYRKYLLRKNVELQ